MQKQFEKNGQPILGLSNPSGPMATSCNFIQNGRKINEIKQQLFDAIIVGTGPGGGTVGRELTKNNKKVLFLELGSHIPLTGSFFEGVKTILVPGQSLIYTKQLLAMVRGITTGGSSIHYYATWFPVPTEMFNKYGIDLAEFVEEAKSELPVAPLKDDMIGPMAGKIMQSARELGYNWNKLDKIMYQDRWLPHHKFGYWGDPNGVKWSSRMFVEEALNKGAFLINRAKVKKVIVEDNHAIGVEFVTKKKRHRLYAPKIILSAGGIGTPIVLRNSGIKEAGFDFFFDPLIGVRGTTKDIKANLAEIPMSAGIHLEDEEYVMTDMAFPPSTTAIFAASIFRFDKMFSYPHTMQIMVKIKDSLSGKVTKKGFVDKNLTSADKKKFASGYARAKQILKNAGATSIFKTWYIAAHPGGTAKVGHIVDSNLETKYKNLYVCDCSVIPEAWGLPPTSTLISLGKYLSKHLRRKEETRRSSRY